jgi:hypothetical protein
MKAVLKLVKDNNGEVQNMAIKWWVLPPESKRVIYYDFAAHL